jgi:hypothetical protein
MKRESNGASDDNSAEVTVTARRNSTQAHNMSVGAY